MDTNQVLEESVASWFEAHDGFELSPTAPVGDNFVDTRSWSTEWGVDQMELEDEIVRQLNNGINY